MAASLKECPWLVQTPSGNPEPDSPSDLWVTRECGAPVTMFSDGWECEAGHEHVEYGSARQQEMEAKEAFMERTGGVASEPALRD